MTKSTLRGVSQLGLLTVAFMLVAGCQTMYYETMEKFGVHKREILVDRVEDARDSQEAAKEQFASALAEFSAVLNFDGGDLEKQYNKLSREFQRSEGKAKAVHDRIVDVERVAKALFKEWEEELEQYSNASLRGVSEEKLHQTRAEYHQLITAMKRAERRVDPVLSALRDQVLFLKHNLNARAIGSLRTELGVVESDIATLIREMEVSITEANQFIERMGLE